ncbi:uncharacterized protein LOC132732627 [Ruditapes philippinarum]|uniref:uncharacterized protein LOC132732627 n=1 Tax=Ruditapes philippinarum TaxID=129788 RepID=UPI00295B1FE8|nr:uncharacterized protein LOC132732627 [Ruditapes philippinarum]
MEFKIYTVPFPAYPRVQYAYKHLEPLLRRYDDLNHTIQLEKWDLTPIETPYRDYINKQTFQLCLQSLEGDRDIDIRNVTKQNDVTDCSKEKCANIKELARKRCLRNSFVVVVASDINKDDIPADYNVKIICPVTDTNDSNVSVESPDATKRVQYVYKEQLYGTVSTIMELNLFKALEVKSYCERLLHILDGVFNSDEVQEKGKCDKNDEIQIFNEVSSLQRSKSVGYVISKADNILDYLKRSKSDIERSLIGYTDKWEVKSDYNLKQRKKQKGTVKDSWKHLSHETIQRIERLSDEMLGMFSRSSLPENERPQFIQLPDKHLTEQLKEDLKNESSSIRSCGYRGCTLVIFVDNDCDTHNLETCLKHLMEKHKIASFSVEPLNIKEFCKVGSKAEAKFGDGETRRSGTLGGFGYAKSRSVNESKIIGLVSRHVVTICDSPATCALIHSEGKTTEVSVDIDKSFADKIKPKDVLDIAAISFKEDTSEFDTTYRTSENKRAKGVLTTYTTEQMKGLPVQICGACTPLGRGTVTMSNIEGVRDSCMEENYIFVEDNITEGKEKEVFCNASDSGAIVCTDDQDNPDNVQLLSMVVGKYTGRENIKKEGVYATLKLKEGIKQVEEETNSSIEFL